MNRKNTLVLFNVHCFKITLIYEQGMMKLFIFRNSQGYHCIFNKQVLPHFQLNHLFKYTDS